MKRTSRERVRVSSGANDFGANDFGANGFSMIELLMALFLLILLVGFTGVGLSGALELEGDSIQLEKATEIAAFIRNEHAAGAEADELVEIVKEEWPESVVRLEQVNDDEKRTWDVWSIQARKDAPGLELEFVQPIYKSSR